MRQRSDLHDGTAALDGGNAGFERGKAARRLKGNVKLRLRQPIGFLVRTNRARGADLARHGERPVKDIGHRHCDRAGEARSDKREATDRAGAGDQHALSKQSASARDRVQSDGERLGEGKLAKAHVSGDRIALAFAQHEILGEHTLHVWKEAGAAKEAHVAAKLLAAFAAVVTAPAGLRWAHGDLVAGLHARDACPDSRRPHPRPRGLESAARG